MAVLATTTNATTNVTPGSPPASVAAAAAGDNDNNNNDNGSNLDTLCCRIHNLRRMLDASANRLVHAKAEAAVACVECARMLELVKRRAGERIRQVEEELRRTRIEAKMFRVGWTRLRVTVGGRGGIRRAEGAEVLLLLAAVAKADNAPPPPPPSAFWGEVQESVSPPPAPPPTPLLIVIFAEDPRWDRCRGGR